RDILLIALIVVVGIRLSVNGFDFNLEGFNFTDFLSLFLAVSSVGLSAAFYFKADESARTFYTHTYRFTKDVSEMLGRIDSGFGEKLRNIDQGYIGLSQKFDSFGLFPKQGESDKDKLEEGNAQIKAERESIMRDLSERADIAESDKRNMLVKMNELTAELEKANSESVMINDVGGYGVTYSFVRFLTPLVFKYCGGIARDSNYERAITKAFTGVLSESEFKSAAYGYMQNAGLLNGPFLTTKGVAFVSDILSGVI
ncbi:hypothetical protein XI53_25765, partial [Salmonella enterica subsp. enterica]|nr:hypothetical protein [Salmonella enterica subsp. enterica serovar Java]